MIRVGASFWVAIFCTGLMGAELVEHRWWPAAVSAILAIGNLAASHVRDREATP